MQVIQHTPKKEIPNQFFYAIETSGKKLRLYIFSPAELNMNPAIKGESEPFSSFIQKVVKTSGLGQGRKIVSGVPGFKESFIYEGTTTFDISEHEKLGTWKNYSIFECPMRDLDVADEWVNFFTAYPMQTPIRSTQVKVAANRGWHVRLLVPFAKDNFDGSQLLMTTRYKPYFISKNISLETEELDYGAPRKVPGWYKYFWTVNSDQRLSVKANESTELPLQLKWNKDSKACKNPGEVMVMADAGYLPYRKIRFGNNGDTKMSFSAMGLKKGDSVALKFQVNGQLEVGEVQVEVV